MTLPTPVLDDRTWAEIAEDLKRRIPVYTREWDPSPADPGTTIVELLAYLGESLLFRFNQIPEASKLAFLRLLDVPLLPAASARGLVTAETRLPGGSLVEQGTEIRAGEVPFETLREVFVLPLETVTVSREISRGPETPEEIDFANAAKDAVGEPAPSERFEYYLVRQVPGEPEAPAAEPVDFGRAVDGCVWVAVLGTRHTVRAELEERILNLGFALDDEAADFDRARPCPGGAGAPPTPALLCFGSTATLRAGQPVYERLRVVADSTAGLTRDGVIRVQLPEDPDLLQPVPVAESALAGTGNRPPVLPDPDQEGRVLFWIRISRAAPARPFGRIRWVGCNATEVVQSRTARPEYLGVGDGQPGQLGSLVHAPIHVGSVLLDVEEPVGWTRWTEVEDLVESGRDDRHFVTDREAGTVRFGDGFRGRVPQPGQRIRVASYRYGGGREGNVPAGALSRCVPHPELKVKNPLRTHGGSDGEGLGAALERVPGEIRRRGRAVTRDDFREFALQTPGVDVGRASVLPLFHPPTHKTDAAGAVTVVVWPRTDPRNPNAPRPTHGEVEAVCAHLDRHRLVTTELWVVPPAYRRIAVAVGVEVKPGYGVEAVRRWVELVVRQYLAPLPPYGPEGEGWPLGRRVHAPELEAAVLQVEGVAYLPSDLRLAVWDEAWTERRTVELDPWEVPELWEITVVQGDPLVPGEAEVPPTYALDDTPVPVLPALPGRAGSAPLPPAPTEGGPYGRAVPLPLPRVEC